MNRITSIMLALGALAALFLLSRSASAATYEGEYFEGELPPYEPPIEGWDTTMEGTAFSVEVPEQYRQPILDNATQFGVPPDVLARLLWQESRFRDDIVFCQTLSSAGAKGIAQFMPATARDVAQRIGYFDPCEPYGSIRASAYYLGSLYKQTGNWLDAVAAYNWGIGNVLQYRAGAAKTIPEETKQYTAAIVGETFA
jgi:soluble lytic murein transglycosylase-like protein